MSVVLSVFKKVRKLFRRKCEEEERLITLHKCRLDSSEVLPFLMDRLAGVNHLSDILLKTIDFETGAFFTLVPEGSNLKRLHEFKVGLVLPQNPILGYLKGDGTTSMYSLVPTIEREFADEISNILNREGLVAIFDDVTRDPTDTDSDSAPYKYINDNKVYYMLDRNSASSDSAYLCLRRSKTFWHSLGVISKVNLQLDDRNLTDEALKDICANASLIFVGAYDGEGYIFWEKNGSNLFDLEADELKGVDLSLYPDVSQRPHWDYTSGDTDYRLYT